MRLRQLLFALQLLGGFGFLFIAAGMLAFPVDIQGLFPWVLGFYIHLFFYLTNGILFLISSFLIRKDRSLGRVIAFVNALVIAVFGVFEYQAGGLYGVGDTLFGVILISLIMAASSYWPFRFSFRAA